MRILITGASGFLGKYLVDHLVETRGKDAVATLGFEVSRPDVTYYPCDLEKEDRAKQVLLEYRPDHIYHLAGVSRVSRDIPFDDYFSRNFLTTAHLVKAIESLGKPVSFFFTSSVHVYGNTEDLASESTTPKPQSAYGFSKYLAEQLLRDTSTRLPGFRAVVGRLYSCIGPGQAPGFVAADLCRKIVEAKRNPSSPLVTGPLSAYRRFLDARDVVRIFPRLLEAPGAQFEIFNIASPHELPIRDLLNILLEEAGIAPPIQSSDSLELNPFQGLRIDTAKLTRLVPESSFRPVRQSLRDMLDWEQARQA